MLLITEAGGKVLCHARCVCITFKIWTAYHIDRFIKYNEFVHLLLKMIFFLIESVLIWLRYFSSRKKKLNGIVIFSNSLWILLMFREVFTVSFVYLELMFDVYKKKQHIYNIRNPRSKAFARSNECVLCCVCFIAVVYFRLFNVFNLIFIFNDTNLYDWRMI